MPTNHRHPRNITSEEHNQHHGFSLQFAAGSMSVALGNEDRFGLTEMVKWLSSSSSLINNRAESQKTSNFTFSAHKACTEQHPFSHSIHLLAIVSIQITEQHLKTDRQWNTKTMSTIQSHMNAASMNCKKSRRQLKTSYVLRGSLKMAMRWNLLKVALHRSTIFFLFRLVVEKNRTS